MDRSLVITPSIGEFILHPMVHPKDVVNFLIYSAQSMIWGESESVPVDLCVDVLYVLPKLNYDSRIG